MTSGEGGENDGVRSHCFLWKAGAMAGEAEGCRTGCKQQQGTASCVWERLLLVHSKPPLHWNRKHVQRVTNAPKEALLMKKI